MAPPITKPSSSMISCSCFIMAPGRFVDFGWFCGFGDTFVACLEDGLSTFKSSCWRKRSWFFRSQLCTETGFRSWASFSLSFSFALASCEGTAGLEPREPFPRVLSRLSKNSFSWFGERKPVGVSSSRSEGNSFGMTDCNVVWGVASRWASTLFGLLMV